MLKEFLDRCPTCHRNSSPRGKTTRLDTCPPRHTSGVSDAGGDAYWVDDAELSPEDRIDLDRRILTFLADRITSVSTDLPAAAPGEWPVEVASAAARLRRHADPDAGPHDYRYADVDLVRDPGLWEAFLLVAPYAYDAQALDAGGAEVLHLSDAGDLRVVLAPRERREVETLIGTHRLVPVEPRRPWWVRWRERLLPRGVR